MEEQKKGFKNIFKRLKEDYVFRTLIFASFSFIVTFAFCVFNLFIGFRDLIVWNIGIGIYYLLLVIIKLIVGGDELRWKKQKLDDVEKEKRRENLYILQSFLLFIIDLALVVPITVMMLQEKVVDYSEIVAITIATYTVYKVVMSSINFYKTRKMNHLSVKIVRNVNFVDSLVSILTLQYTLIMTFGSGFDDGLKTVCAISSFTIWIALIILSVVILVHAIKTKKNKPTA